MVIEDQRAEGSEHRCKNDAEDERRELPSDVVQLERQGNVNQGGCGCVRHEAFR